MTVHKNRVLFSIQWVGGRHGDIPHYRTPPGGPGCLTNVNGSRLSGLVLNTIARIVGELKNDSRKEVAGPRRPAPL